MRCLAGVPSGLKKRVVESLPLYRAGSSGMSAGSSWRGVSALAVSATTAVVSVAVAPLVEGVVPPSATDGHTALMMARAITVIPNVCIYLFLLILICMLCLRCCGTWTCFGGFVRRGLCVAVRALDGRRGGWLVPVWPAAFFAQKYKNSLR